MLARVRSAGSGLDLQAHEVRVRAAARCAARCAARGAGPSGKRVNSGDS